MSNFLYKYNRTFVRVILLLRLYSDIPSCRNFHECHILVCVICEVDRDVLISVAKTNEAAADDSVKLTMSTNITKKSGWQTANAPQA